MLTKIGVIVIAAYVSSAVGVAIPTCTCGKEQSPVCGSDGKTYSNDCLLNCASAEDSTLSIAHAGPCQDSQCSCDATNNPVCGSDGKTYNNDCELNCATAHDSLLSVSYYGECQSSTQPPSACLCGRSFKPVCGSNGKTYNNDCELNCASAQDSTLSVAYYGECQSSTQPPSACTCGRSYQPVCGSDGKTYNSDCELNCATAQDSSLSIAYQGECVASPSPVSSCNCGRSLTPVCGSDGKTYNNECELNCATAQDSSLSVSHYGECEAYSLPSTCNCGRSMKPVCGSDGKTYNNECELNCATAQDSTLSVANYGACEALPPSPCNCGRSMKPVCGSDGKTYNNECELNCATAQDSTLSVANYGECEALPPSPCNCGRSLKPVCGSNGRTYNNECELNCATAQDPSLSVARYGPCKLSVAVVDVTIEKVEPSLSYTVTE